MKYVLFLEVLILFNFIYDLFIIKKFYMYITIAQI